MSNIIVAGGCGFIGYHLCKKLLSENNNVILIDDLTSGELNRLEELKEYLNTFVYVGSLSHKNFIDSFLSHFDDKFENIDVIYNVSNSLTDSIYKKYPVKTLDTAYIGTKNLLNIAELKHAKYVHLSTNKIDNIKDSFIESFRIAELLTLENAKQRKIKTQILRVPDVYGTCMSEENFIINIIKNIIKGEKVIISEKEHTVNSCCFVDDVISEIQKNSDINIPYNSSNIYNFTITELLDILKEIFKDGFNIENHLTSSKQKLLSVEQRNNFKNQIEKIVEYEKESIK